MTGLLHAEMHLGSFSGGGSPNLLDGTNGILSKDSVDVFLNGAVALPWVNCKLVSCINLLKIAVMRCYHVRSLLVLLFSGREWCGSWQWGAFW